MSDVFQDPAPLRQAEALESIARTLAEMLEDAREAHAPLRVVLRHRDEDLALLRGERDALLKRILELERLVG